MNWIVEITLPKGSVVKKCRREDGTVELTARVAMFPTVQHLRLLWCRVWRAKGRFADGYPTDGRGFMITPRGKLLHR